MWTESQGKNTADLKNYAHYVSFWLAQVDLVPARPSELLHWHILRNYFRGNLTLYGEATPKDIGIGSHESTMNPYD